MLGYVIIIIGLGIGAHYAHIPQHWIVVGVLVLVGMGIAGGVSKTRYRDPS